MSDKELLKVGRLAFRVEGDWWNAYYAPPNTMEEAIHLGSILTRLVEDDRAKQSFMDTMRIVVANIIEEATGLRPEWREPETAPEHERAGRG